VKTIIWLLAVTFFIIVPFAGTHWIAHLAPAEHNSAVARISGISMLIMAQPGFFLSIYVATRKSLSVIRKIILVAITFGIVSIAIPFYLSGWLHAALTT